MQDSKWINRGTSLGLCMGVLIGVVVSSLLPQQTRSTVETPKMYRGPALEDEWPKAEPDPAPSNPANRKPEQANQADQIKKLERLTESLRAEIEASEKQIALLARANSPEENAKRIALLQIRHVDAVAEYNRAGRELLKLEAELAALKKQLTDATTANPDPVLVAELLAKDPRVAKAKEFLTEKQGDLTKLKQAYDEAVKIAKPEVIEAARKIDTANKKERVMQLEGRIVVKKEEREKLKEVCDILKKLIDAGTGGGIDIQALRDSLKPQKESLDKINVELAKLRLKQKPNP